MLHIAPAPPNEYPRLHLQGVRATAWIEHRSWHLRGVDWQLWIERGGTVTSAKCPLRLEIESSLRSWVLLTSGVPLYPGFPIWIRRTRPKAAETLARPRIPSFTRRVRQDSATSFALKA